MKRLILTTTVVAALAGPAWADDPKKDALLKDPEVRQSLDPQLTQLGHNQPKSSTTESSDALQAAMDRAHQGSTGTTRDGGTREPANEPPGLADAPTGSPGQLGGSR